MRATAASDYRSHARWTVADRRARALFAVEGMRCAACARSIERAVRALPGIEHFTVNAATARAAVDWDPTRIDLERILRAVTAAGFAARPLAGETATAAYRTERRTMLKRIGLAGLGMMQTMMLVYGLYAVTDRGIDPAMEQYLRVISMLIATPVLLYSGAPFFRGALRDLRRRTLGMDVPVSLALLLAHGASSFNTLQGRGEVYFDSVTMFIFLLLAGRFIEMTVRHGSLTASEALSRSLPSSVLRVCADGSTERVATSAVRAGERLKIPKGAVIPVDARLASGDAVVDESLVTGESVPVLKREHGALLGGSLNVGEAIEIVAQSDVGGSALAAIVALLERAQADRPRIALSADRMARWFVLVILALAALVGIAWTLLEPGRAFAATLAVLVVTCPCALSLATPAAIAAATTRLAHFGLLVTRADAIERLAQADTVVIDKTGTLTEGASRLKGVTAYGAFTPEETLRIAAALERTSIHPLAAAFAAYDDASVVPADIEEHAGRGIEGHIGGKHWRLGRADFVAELRADGCGGSWPTLDADDLCLGDEQGLAAVFSIADSIRADARRAVQSLRELGLTVLIASGDRVEAVRRAASELGIEEAAGRLSPQQKIAVVRERQRRGERVLMVGDGINDGPVLAAAHVSCAMGQGSAIAQAAADLLLLTDSLQALADGIRAARRTLCVMRQNLRWAFAYNVCAVPLAAFGLIAPWVAAIGMSASSLIVVLNARRLAAGRAALSSLRAKEALA